MNSLQADLTNSVVVIHKAVFPSRSPYQLVFEVQGGFGCLPQLIGRAIFGKFLHSGEKCRLDGCDVERFATDDDIRAAMESKAKAG